MTSEALKARIEYLRAYVRKSGGALLVNAPATVANAAALVLDERSPMHQQFVEAGSSVGLSREMVAEGLRNALGQLTERNLRDYFLECAGGSSFRSPELVFHVLAGNLFVSGIESINTAVLAGAGSLVRCSYADQLFPRLWCEALCRANSAWEQALFVTHWSTDQVDLTRAACDGSDVVVAFGRDESVMAVRELTPADVRFIEHGTKVSFAIVAANAIRKDTALVAEQLAYDFSVYDQQGCLSPRAAFLGSATPDDLAEFRKHFTAAMRRLQRELPPGPKQLPEAAALARERSEAQIEAALNEGTQLWSGPTDQFVIALRSLKQYQLGCMNRFADLRLFESAEQLLSALEPFKGRIATMGLSETRGEWRQLADHLSVDRVCTIGEMQKPPLGWTHDGRQPLVDLLHFNSSK